MNLLVDTHAFIWFANADPQLPERTRSMLRSPDNDLWFSAASAWEIAVKYQLGRLKLALQAWDFIADARRRLAIEPLPFEDRAVAHLPKLPPIHNDPFDRMLICQSIEHDMTIVTNDRLIRQYPVRTLWLEDDDDNT